MTASDQIAGALALVPSLADHAVIPGSAPPQPELDDAWAMLERAVTLEPASAVAHALRGSLLVRRGETLSARRSYALAASLDPYDAPSRIALGELANMAGDALESEAWFREAFALTQYYPRVPRPGAHTALVLLTMGPWPRNVPLDFVLDPDRWTPQRWYLPSEGAAQLPPCDVVFNGISGSDSAEPALAAAEAFIATRARPVLNDPERVRATSRARLAETLRDVRGARATESRRVSRDELLRLAIEEPLLVRPADTHGGRGLERIENASALARYAAAYSAAEYDVAPFVEYRSADGFYRKYRIMYVGGEAYPYHLAIDPAWMIHYISSATALFDWMRDEERLFLRRPERALDCWSGAVRDIASAVGLDYFGIDCTVLADGTLFVFEADAAMLVHNFDPDPGKIAAHGRIAQALDALLAERAG